MPKVKTVKKSRTASEDVSKAGNNIRLFEFSLKKN